MNEAGGTSDQALLEELKGLEIERHQPEVRGNVARLKELLHPDFFEFGRSGRHWTREACLDAMPKEGPIIPVQSDRDAAPRFDAARDTDFMKQLRTELQRLGRCEQGT